MRGSIRGGRKNKYKRRRIIAVLVIILILATIVTTFIMINAKKSTENNSMTSKVEGDKQEEKVIPEDITFNLVAIGDIMCHSTNFKAAYNSSTNQYDFSPVFVNVAKYITKADISIRKP